MSAKPTAGKDAPAKVRPGPEPASAKPPAVPAATKAAAASPKPTPGADGKAGARIATAPAPPAKARPAKDPAAAAPKAHAAPSTPEMTPPSPPVPAYAAPGNPPQRPGMAGLRPAFSLSARLPIHARRGAGLAEHQAGAPAVSPEGPSVKVDFKAGDMVVYPTHGVGTVQGIEDMEVVGTSLQVITVTFEENRMTLRVPTNKAATAGLRKLAGPAVVKQALDTLRGRARIKRTMWSRRAQEYEAKINSGDPIAISEVVRDLFRNAGQPDQSFSERQIYEQALDRLAMEFAAIEKTDKLTAIDRLITHMRGGEKGGDKAKAAEPIIEDDDEEE